MKSTKFSILGEKVDFDLNGDPIASYDLMNWRREQDGSLRLVRVGFYDASLSPKLSLAVNESAIQWPVGQQVCSLKIPPRPHLPLRLLCVILSNALGNLQILALHLLDILFVHLQQSRVHKNVYLKYNVYNFFLKLTEPLQQFLYLY